MSRQKCDFIKLVIPWIEPRRGHLLQSSKADKATWYCLLSFFGCLHLAMVLVALGYPVSINRVAFLLTGVMLIVMGSFLSQVRSNYFFGARTPWTLSSELSWKKTHLLAGRMFLGWGWLLAIAVAANLSGILMLWLITGGSVVLITVMVVYSFLIWRKDPDRET